MKKYFRSEISKIKIITIRTWILLLIFMSIVYCGCQKTKMAEPWNEKYDFIYDIQPIIFHYDHGIIAGSYKQNQETRCYYP